MLERFANGIVRGNVDLDRAETALAGRGFLLDSGDRLVGFLDRPAAQDDLIRYV